MNEISTEIKKIVLPNGKEIILNEQQVVALSSMKEWLEDKHELFFTLSGFAGTGKTTCVFELIKIFKEINRWARIAVSAPTHKAKKVIERATKEDSFTIQKLLGLRPNTDLENYDINNPQFDEKAPKEIAGFKLVIIDESSMLNSSLFYLIIQEATLCRTKVLFMGDEAQLPPVKESISKIFTEVGCKAHLTKVERQKDSNPVMGIYDLIRSNIKSSVDLFEHKSNVNEKEEGIEFFSNQQEIENKILPLFVSEEYKKNSDFIKVITYTNGSVQAWNKRIREYIYPNATDPILEGEILFAYNSVMLDQSEILIENSSDYKVQKVKSAITDNGIDVYVVHIVSVDTNIKSQINIVKEEGKDKFLIEFNRLLKFATTQTGKSRGYAWRNYYGFKNRHLLLENILDSNGKLLVKKDIDYGYAITTHKSQGSTFVNVAVSENNLDINKNSEERNKLKYVAFSRPTNKIFVLSNKTI